MNANEVQLATAEDSGVGSSGEESRNERPGIDLHVTKAAAHDAARAALLARHDANRKMASAISAASAHVDELLRAVGLDGTRSVECFTRLAKIEADLQTLCNLLEHDWENRRNGSDMPF
jgi:hypothetical protein